MQVQTGFGANGEIETINVPVHYASQDRVVSWINSRFTQNKSFSLPMMSVYMTGIEITPERRKGVGTIDRKVYLPQNGVFPSDLTTLHRLMPIPYDLNMDLYIVASNSDQSFQMIEQILMMFDPAIQIQANDKQADWAKITQVEMVGIGNEETIPIGTEKRAIVWNFQFRLPIWIAPPVVVRDNVIQTIVHRITTGNIAELSEITDDGDILTFESKFE
jgi:hypothetical protein